MNTADPGVSMLPALPSLAVGVTITSPAFKGAIPFPLSGISLGLQCNASARATVEVASWNAGSTALVPAAAPVAGSGARTQLDVIVGFHVYLVAFEGSRITLASDRHTALAVTVSLPASTSASCGVPVVSTGLVRNGTWPPAFTAPDFSLSPTAWTVCTSAGAACAASSVDGLPVLAAYADIQPCPSGSGWRGWPAAANAAGGPVASLARYLPARCRNFGLDVVAFVYLAINSVILLAWLSALVLRPLCGRTVTYGEMSLLLGMFLCVLDQVTDALWFLLTDWDASRLAFEYASFTLIVLNQAVFGAWGAFKLASFFAPLVVRWLHGIINIDHATLCGLKPWADRVIADNSDLYPRKHKGVYRLWFSDHSRLEFLLLDIVWVAILICITPALLAVQSALYSTQLMALKSVAKGWSKIMGIPLYMVDDSSEMPALNAPRFDKGAWNRARLMEILFEALLSVCLQAVGLVFDAKDGMSSSGIAIASFAMSTYMLLHNSWSYFHAWCWYGVHPLHFDPSVSYYKLKQEETLLKLQEALYSGDTGFIDAALAECDKMGLGNEETVRQARGARAKAHGQAVPFVRQKSWTNQTFFPISSRQPALDPEPSSGVYYANPRHAAANPSAPSCP